MSRRPLLLIAVCLLACPALFARQQNAARPQPKVTGFRAEFLANLDEVEEKIMSLAESTPADKYGWRPVNDVRATSEVYMHVAGGNYFLSTFIGTRAPANLKQDAEKTVTTKAEVLAHLRKSFQHLRTATGSLKDADLEKTVKMFGTQTTYRAVLITMLSHLHEHLGQCIAYGRMTGVVPPWSR